MDVSAGRIEQFGLRKASHLEFNKCSPREGFVDMLKVLHADKARMALGFSSHASEKEVDDAQIAEEFRSLLNNERGKGAHVATCDSAEAMSLAMAVQALTAQAPAAADKGSKEKELGADSKDTTGEDDVLATADEAADGSEGRLFFALKERGESQRSLNQDDDNELPTPDGSQDETGSAETTVETPDSKASEEVEEWSQEVVAEVSAEAPAEVTNGAAAMAPEIADEEAPIAVPASPGPLSDQVAVRPERAEAGARVATETADKMSVISSVAEPEAATEGAAPVEVEVARVADRKGMEAKPPVEVSIQPQVIKDVEITPFIADSAASMVKRSNEVSAQMMMLRQAFESVRGAQGRESAAAIKAVGASAGGSGGAGSGALGGAFKGANSESPLVREKAQPPLSRAATYRMLERINATLKEAARARDGKTISLHLEPVDLGKIKVDVSLKEGALHARLTPENGQVIQALREHAHELQAALRRLGLDVEKVTVNVSAEHQGQEFSPEQQNLGDGKGFQGNRNNMPQDSAQLAENTFGNELALGREGVEAAVEEAKTARVASWRDNWVA